MNSEKTPEPRKKRKGLHRFGLWSFGILLVLTMALGLGVWGIMGRAVVAPDWLRLQVENRLNASIPQVDLSFSALEFTLHQGWRPKARVRNIVIKNPDGAEIFGFSEAEVQMAMRPLLRAQIKPKNITITGVFATLLRDKDGQISLRGGGGLGVAAQQADNLPALIGQLDTAFELPLLSALQNADVRSLTLRYEDARVGRVWVVDGGRVRLTREQDDLTISADFAVLSGGTNVATLEANYTSKIGKTQAQFGINVADFGAQDIALQNPALAWLSVLRAPISGALRSGVKEDGSLDVLSATLQIGKGVVQPNEATKPIPFSSARTYLTFDPKTQYIDFNDITISSQWLTGQIVGQAYLGRVEGGLLNDLVGQFQLTGITLNPKELYETPVVFDAADMDFKLTLDPFQLKIGRMQLMDGNLTVYLDGTFSADDEGWRYAGNSQIESISSKHLLDLWPQSLVGPTRDWVKRNLFKADLSHIEVALRGEANHPVNTFFSFDFDKGKARILETMPPITQASGRASLLANRFVISVEEGQIVAPEGGKVNVAGSSFIIPDVANKKGGAQGEARLKIESTITAALSLLNQPKLEIMDKANLPVTMAKGRAQLSGGVRFPLRRGVKAEDIKYNAQGTLTSVQTDALVPNKIIAAKSLKIEASQDGVRIWGPGRIGAVSFDAQWSQPLGRKAQQGGKVKGTVELSQRVIDEFNLGLPDGTLNGTGRGTMTFDLADVARPSFTLTSNMRGLGMSVPAIGWRKGTGSTGSLTLKGRLGKSPVVDVVLKAPNLSARGKITTLADGSFDRANFSRVTVGKWLRAPVVIKGQGAGAPVAIEVAGGILDLRTAEFGESESGGQSSDEGGPLKLRLDRLQITDTLALMNMQGVFSTKSGLDGRFTAALNGGAKLQGRVMPQNGRSAIRITSQDAGGVFASAELLKQARGGDLSLTLWPVGKGGAFDGDLRVVNTRIKGAPVIADILSALSIIGLLEQLSGDGIQFSEIEAAFRLTPSMMTLTRASAIGPSMGISMDGTYDVVRSTLNMQGVVSPIYLLNGIGSIFTRKGEGLIGFNYRLRGPSSNPKVRVNPLSALTPGMFREIFRSPAPKLPKLEGERVKERPKTGLFGNKAVRRNKSQNPDTDTRAAQRKRDLRSTGASDR